MPAEAIKAGAVDQVLGIDDVYAAIEKRVLEFAERHLQECANASGGPGEVESCETEQIILFRVSGQLFAVSSASVQEVRQR